MTKKLLVIASSLLFIVGCESELDRCMEANTSKFAIEYMGDNSDEIKKMVTWHPIFEASMEKLEADFDEYLEMGCRQQRPNESEECLAKYDRIEDKKDAAWQEAADAITEELATEYCNSQGIY